MFQVFGSSRPLFAKQTTKCGKNSEISNNVILNPNLPTKNTFINHYYLITWFNHRYFINYATTDTLYHAYIVWSLTYLHALVYSASDVHGSADVRVYPDILSVFFWQQTWEVATRYPSWLTDALGFNGVGLPPNPPRPPSWVTGR